MAVAGRCHIFSADRIDPVSLINFSFALIDGCHGCAVNHHVRFMESKAPIKGGGIGDIRCFVIGGNHFDSLQLMLQGTAEHAIRASNQYFHRSELQSVLEERSDLIFCGQNRFFLIGPVNPNRRVIPAD